MIGVVCRYGSQLVSFAQDVVVPQQLTQLDAIIASDLALFAVLVDRRPDIREYLAVGEFHLKQLVLSVPGIGSEVT